MEKNVDKNAKLQKSPTKKNGLPADYDDDLDAILFEVLDCQKTDILSEKFTLNIKGYIAGYQFSQELKQARDSLEHAKKRLQDFNNSYDKSEASQKVVNGYRNMVAEFLTFISNFIYAIIDVFLGFVTTIFSFFNITIQKPVSLEPNLIGQLLDLFFGSENKLELERAQLEQSYNDAQVAASELKEEIKQMIKEECLESQENHECRPLALTEEDKQGLRASGNVSNDYDNESDYSAYQSHDGCVMS